MNQYLYLHNNLCQTIGGSFLYQESIKSGTKFQELGLNIGTILQAQTLIHIVKDQLHPISFGLTNGLIRASSEAIKAMQAHILAGDLWLLRWDDFTTLEVNATLQVKV
jgi:hypothetical protein